MQVLDFPFIVKLKDCFRTHYHSYIVMEFIKGQTLADILEKNEKTPLPFDKAKRWAAQIFLCLQYLHGLGVVHRDLKPDNIMIGESEHIKLMDFGVAFRVDYKKGRCGSVRKIGARGFKAPEMLTGKEYGFSIDWWNFGVILYVMMTGSHPFHKEGGWKGLFGRNQDKNALKKDVKYPKSIPPEAKDLISKLLIRDPWKRLGVRVVDDKDQEKFEGLKAKKIEKDQQREARERAASKHGKENNEIPEDDDDLDVSADGKDKEGKEEKEEKEKENGTNKKKKRKMEDAFLIDASEDVAKHPFFTGIDFQALLEEGKKTRFESDLSFPPDEKPEFADVEAVLQRFKDIDPASHLEKLGLWDG